MRRRAAACENVLGLRDLAGRRLAQEVADHLPVRCGIGGGNEIFEMRAHRSGDTAEQHDRDVAFAAFELCDVTLGNSGHPGEHLARHAAQRAHGADALAELLEKTGFGIKVFGHIPCRALGCGGRLLRKHNADED